MRAYKYKELGYRELRAAGISVFDEHPSILLSTAIHRAFIAPVCTQLFWLFSMCDLDIGSVEYNVSIAVPLQICVLGVTAVATYARTKQVEAD